METVAELPCAASMPHTDGLRVEAPRHTAPFGDLDDTQMLGQCTPLQHQFRIVTDGVRRNAFREAIDYAVTPGARVVELGAGDVTLSLLAARRRAKVTYVEGDPAAAVLAREAIARRGLAGRVEVLEADPAEYLPQDLVDVVLCEHMHPAMLKKKQLSLLRAFKQRYARRFGARLPVFVPDAVILAVQPVSQHYEPYGLAAPVPTFVGGPGFETSPLASAEIYGMLEHRCTYSEQFAFDRVVSMTATGEFNALRFITRSLVAIVFEEHRSIDWDLQHLVLPLERSLSVREGDMVRVTFAYEAGGDIASLLATMHAERVPAAEACVVLQ